MFHTLSRLPNQILLFSTWSDSVNIRGHLVVAVMTILCLVDFEAAAEIDDLSLSTMEYAAELQRIRGLKLEPLPLTKSWTTAKIRDESRRQPLFFDPRPSLRRDRALYEALGVIQAGKSGVAQIEQLQWPWLPAAYFGKATGRPILVVDSSSGARLKGGHIIAVNLAALTQSFGAKRTQDNRDRQLAVESLFFGDAVLAWLDRVSQPEHEDDEARAMWVRARLDELLDPSALADVNDDFVSRLTYARFQTGIDAAIELRKSTPWSIFDEFYRRGLPRSTAQLLHPQAIIQDKQSRDLTAPAIPVFAKLGQPQRGIVGELTLRLWLDHWLEQSVATRATAGWAGDIYALYSDNEQGSPSRLVLMTAWDELDEPANDEARDFEGAVGVLLSKRFGQQHSPLQGLPDGASGWVSSGGLATFVERREDRVLFVVNCDQSDVPVLREQVWQGWTVGRPDLGVVGELRPAPPEPIATLPPSVPWYRGTPGIVALTLWLILALPALSFLVGRWRSRSPILIYAIGMVSTAVIVLLGWLLGF